jgi:hypothetical protein
MSLVTARVPCLSRRRPAARRLTTAPNAARCATTPCSPSGRPPPRAWPPRQFLRLPTCASSAEAGKAAAAAVAAVRPLRAARATLWTPTMPPVRSDLPCYRRLHPPARPPPTLERPAKWHASLGGLGADWLCAWGGGGGCMKRHVGREERDALGERLHLVRAVRARAHPRHAQGALRCRPLRAREVGGRGGGARVAHRYLETGTRRMPRRPGALKAPCSRFPGRGESQPASQPVGGPRRLHGRGQAGTCTHAC